MKLSINQSSSLSKNTRHFLTPEGRTMYKIDAQINLTTRKTHIYRTFSSMPEVPLGVTTPDLVENGESYTRIATIEYHQTKPTIFHFEAGKESCSEHDLFKGGKNPLNYTYHSREFVGPDGETYTWKIQVSSETPKLYNRMDEEVAAYDRAHLGVLSPSPGPATLDIATSVEHMANLIVITWAFVYGLIEQTREGFVGTW
ncbi:hypothetical protein D9613_004698 [Agrocybe pediades]|uniref:DUF6593 domain-containing protein n=1 Tax=Agrocybe pediades TaxID=84607 RepID=A0A8H4VR01_9AGAR|nr:hypothetical protein D9613_004698 [Agrocybe pediades]